VRVGDAFSATYVFPGEASGRLSEWAWVGRDPEMLRNDDFRKKRKHDSRRGAILLENLISLFGWLTATGSHTGRTGIKQKSVEGKAWGGKRGGKSMEGKRGWSVEGKGWREKRGRKSVEGQEWREKLEGKAWRVEEKGWREERGGKGVEGKAWKGKHGGTSVDGKAEWKERRRGRSVEGET
jgi:hypothetical protein